MKELIDNAGDRLRERVWGLWRDQLWVRLGDQLGDMLWGQLWGRLGNQLRDQLDSHLVNALREDL